MNLLYSGGVANRAPRFRVHLVLQAMTLAAACSACVTAAPEQNSARMKRLVEKIARGDEVEAAAASERLIEMITAPVAESIGSLESRPAEEQLRLRRVLTRLTGALGARIFRLDLSPEDRKLYDDFVSAYPNLVERLFDGDWRIRMTAVQQIPLEKNTAAGLLIAARVNDEDADVADAALRAAAKLKDPITARVLTRYVADAVKALKSGFYGSHEEDLKLVTAVFVQRSISVIAGAKYETGAEAAIEAVRFFSETPYWSSANRASALYALGQLNDDRVKAVLMEHLDDNGALIWRPAEENKRITALVGDIALASLLNRFDLRAEDFNLRTAKDDPTFAGFITSEERKEARRAFRIWYEQNVLKGGDSKTQTGSDQSEE